MDVRDRQGTNSWSNPSCLKLFGAFMAILKTATGIFYAIEDYTEGRCFVVIFLLASILVVSATRREPK